MGLQRQRRVLVTGGAGFIGSHVAEAFVNHGDAVTVADNLSTGRRENVPGAAEFVEIDVTSSDIADMVREGEFDVIAHLAAQIDVRASVSNPMRDLWVNVYGTLQLMEAVRASRGASTRVIFSSTGGALYSNLSPPPHGEEAHKDPESPYGVAKLAAEHYLAYYARVHKLDTVALRYANVYGPRQDPHGEAGVVAIFCECILNGRPLSVYGDGQQTRDYVFVEDVARSNIEASNRPLPPPAHLDARAFNVGTGIETSVIALASALANAAGTAAPRLEYLPARQGEVQRSAVEISKAEALLNWRSPVELRDGLARTLRWFAARYGHGVGPASDGVSVRQR